MVETLTPAGCGGRHRQLVAVALFTAASVAAAAVLGGLLGWVGGLVDERRPLIVAAGLLALAGALREAGILRVRVPDFKRQVPEHWRRTLPLPVWTSGYGAILGSGFGTYQPAATYWVLLAGVTAMGRPVEGAIVMGIFGLTRGVMVVAPGRHLLGSFARAARAIRPANALVLAAVALAALPAVAQAENYPPSTGRSDPSFDRGNLAYTRWVAGVPQVEVRAADGTVTVFPDGRSPSIFGNRLAYQDAAGIRLVDWTTGALIRRVGGEVTRPALHRAWLAYVRHSDYSNRLQVRHLGTNRLRTLARISPDSDLGRPSIVGDLIAWHENDGGGHVVYKMDITGRSRRVIAQGARRFMVRDPALGSGRTAWIYNDAELTSIWVRNSRGVSRVVATVMGPRYIYTNMEIDRDRILVSRWNMFTGAGTIDTIPLINI